MTKCCKTEKGECPAGSTADAGCCKKEDGCCISRALGVPPCVVRTVMAIALVAITATVTLQYAKRK